MVSYSSERCNTRIYHKYNHNPNPVSKFATYFMMENSALEDRASSELKEASRFIFFNDRGNILASNFAVDILELTAITHLFLNRDEAIKSGMILLGNRYEIHKHHPPLVYGRTMGKKPEESEAFAVCKVETLNKILYGLITYQMPNISARMVPILQSFCQKAAEEI